jgi:hypothetical protein
MVAIIIIPMMIKARDAAKRTRQTENETSKPEDVDPDALLKKRFVHSGDLANTGMYMYHVKDNTTGKEYLLVSISAKEGLIMIDVTPPLVKAEAETKEKP